VRFKASRHFSRVYPKLNVIFFWSRNFALYEETDVRLLIVNSSAFHGINSDDPSRVSVAEYQHGRVSDRTIGAILKMLPASAKQLNILLTHHHFYKNERLAPKDYSTMINGTKLVEELKRATGACWFILHGHQHYPDIFYAPGASTSPIIFSAGSLARRLNELRRESANQFYHISFPIDQYDTLGWPTCGVCHAWDWVPDEGWKPARDVAKIPRRAGFGCRNSPVLLARQIGAIVGEDASNWNDIVASIPELKYALPSDLREIENALSGMRILVYGKPFIERCQVCRERI